MEPPSASPDHILTCPRYQAPLISAPGAMEGEGRSKRQVGPRGGKARASALQELAELRKTGGKRADRFEIKEEEQVYDVVDEEQYARLVQKRREEGGAPCGRSVWEGRQHGYSAAPTGAGGCLPASRAPVAGPAAAAAQPAACRSAPSRRVCD